MNESLFVALQRVTPHHALSRLVGKLAKSHTPWIKSQFIRWFIDKYHVDMSLAEHEDPATYPSFNAFFTRALKPAARPIDTAPSSLVCPADGLISQAGTINDGRILQAKGQNFTVNELLGGDISAAQDYQQGSFATVYLAPRDYHRVHMPCTGKLRKMVFVPGRLFSVNQTTSEQVPRLFARNERVVCHFDGEHGPFVMVLVGAMIVASIETVWAGAVAPVTRGVKTTHYDRDMDVYLKKGEEMGRFLLGSTVITLFPPDTMNWRSGVSAAQRVNMGEAIGDWLV